MRSVHPFPIAATLAAVLLAIGNTTLHGQAPATAPAVKFGFSPGGGLTTTVGQPIVVDLDRNGQPEIVFVGIGGFASRRLIAVHGLDGLPAFGVDVFRPSAVPPIVIGDPYAELAAGDLDGDGFPEIIAVDAHDGTAPDAFRRSLLAFRNNGALFWSGQDVVSDPLIDSTAGFTKPVIADIDGNGTPEIIVGYAGRGPMTPAGVSSEDYVTVFDSLGQIRWTARGGGTNQGASPTANAPVVVDLDLDGSPEILFSDDVFSSAGALLRSVNDVNLRVAHVSVANFNDDPFAEILYQDTFARLHLYDRAGVRIWGPITPPGPQAYAFPAIADVTGDGLPEIIVTRHQTLEVLARDGAAVRTVPLPEPGFGGNVTTFDLNGDGTAEIIYRSARGPFDTGTNQGAVYVFDGVTGTRHAIYAPRNGGDDQRGAIVADVDGNGSAEIVVGGWNEATLLRVFTSAAGTWAQTRPIWNQFGYHVTHVRSDGTIPPYAPINWLTPGLNSFGVNGFPDVALGPVPAALADGYGTSSGSALTVAAPAVLANDNAYGASVMVAALVSAPGNGTVTLSASGSFMYTPASGFSGVDSFTYRPVTASGPGNVATVSITVASATVPLPPTGFRVVNVAGNSASFAWTPPAFGVAPTGFRLEGGVGPGEVLGTLPLGLGSSATVTLPTGAFYLRVRTLAGAAISAVSNEIRVFVNVPAPPEAPTNLLGLVNGQSLHLAWRNPAAGGAPTAIVLDVSGAATLSMPLGVTDAFSFAGVPPGTYTFAVRAVNGSGSSAASNPVTLQFPGACSGAPLPPADFTSAVAGRTVSLGWRPAADGPAPTGYVLNVTGAFVGNVPVAGRALAAAVPPGTYVVTVVATNPCGSSGPTAPRTLTVS